MRYLAYFTFPPDYKRFCIAELKALFSIHNIPPSEIFEFPTPELYEIAKAKPYLINEQTFPTFPFVFLKPQDHKVFKEVTERAILLKSIIRLFSTGKSHEELIQNVDREEMKPFFESKDFFSFVVECHDRAYS